MFSLNILALFWVMSRLAKHQGLMSSEVLSLRHKSWVGCQSLLSDRHQTDIIRLTLWQGANYTASVLT